ncbi:EndoU domain-containing protein [Carbonactinospora thermoautotrophica]|uniref:EndoU domain-containing protein n=2 Tax=Carbonactinospora thermoautotrophica TaxID=1469144 RepID=UPI003DA99111
MSILLPGELVTVLDLLGFTWPQADEDKLEDCARAWRDFANEVEHVLADADRVVRAVVAENQGASIAAFEDYWPRLGGGSGQLCEAADAARLVAEVLEGFAEAVRWAKRLVLAQLVACAASLAAGPLSAVAQQGFRLAIRKALDELLERVVTSLLPRLKSEVGEVFERILREPRRHLEDFADNLRASLQGMGGPPLALAGAGDVPAGPLARRLDDLTHVEGGGGGPNIMAMLSSGGAARLGRRPKGDLPPHVIDHILEGEIKNGRLVGYHHRPGGRDIPNRKTVKKKWIDQREGIYTGEVWGREAPGKDWVKKRNISTFMPDHWTREQVEHAVRRAWENAEIVDEPRRLWRGNYRGLEFEGYYDADENATTAYITRTRGRL